MFLLFFLVVGGGMSNWIDLKMELCVGAEMA